MNRALRRIAVLLCVLFGTTLLFSDELKFIFVKGDKFRVVSQVQEDVYINKRYNNSAEILNRIAFEVADTRQDGSGFLKGNFVTSVRYNNSTVYVSDGIYDSQYWHSPLGIYEIAPIYYMPIVRNVPTFPNKNIEPGDTWTAPGEERHDFRKDFGIPEPYVIPIDVRYRYVRRETINGKTIAVISASYTIFYQPGPPSAWRKAYPILIARYSDQVHYFDIAEGRLLSYKENFRFIFQLSNGLEVEYRGIAEAEVIEAELMDRQSMAQSIQEAVKGMQNVSVQQDERGVTISLENIQFVADSTKLLPGEEEKIKKIAEILKQYPGRNIQVSGHTALAGTPEARMKLSIERAKVIAEMLVALGARKPEEIIIVGYGAERPIADNSTPEGMARNRRVEITILEN
ncbi:MAG TPA: OmpA family protein [Spirochaetales bacterium]|nr:OmpA family protein [Spirochaetales bacterium]